MRKNNIADFFSGVGTKRLSAVEVDTSVSHQHEFNGVIQFKQLFGENRLDNIPAQFLYLTDEDDEMIEDTGNLTWYDSRENHPTRSEFRLYFTPNEAINESRPGDLLIIAKRSDSHPALVIIVKQGSTIENQLVWLFGFGDMDLQTFYVKTFDPERLDQIDLAARIILQRIGIELPDDEAQLNAYVTERYQGIYPKTKVFSHDVYQYLIDRRLISLQDDPDAAISLLLQTEETFFKIIEKGQVQEKIDQGFNNVEDFISYSLSVQNRRKSRAGSAFENHLETLFTDLDIRYDRGGVTENGNKPDFIFPGIREYANLSFSAANLTMLGVKTTCKDRWRQILPEANRIERKHLATIEPSISQKQTDQMEEKKVILVLPTSLHKTYNDRQRNIIMSIGDFIRHVRTNQGEK